MKTKIMIQMTKKVAAAGVLMLLASCDVKDPIFNTSHPGHAMVTLTTDWSAIGEGLHMPSDYSVEAILSTSDRPAYSAFLTGVTNKLDHLFEPGDYRFYVYNAPEEVGSVENGVVNVIAEEVAPPDAVDAPDDAPERIVYPSPDWIFTCVLNAALAADTEYNLTAPMRQQIRSLTLLIEPTGDASDRITQISGTLSGVAGTYDMKSDTHGAPSHAPLWFEKITSGPDAGKWAASVRLLGVVGPLQQLKGTILFEQDTPPLMPVESDLSEALASFNDDKRTPLTLGGTVVQTPDEAGFTATIDDWENVSKDTIVAE